MSGGSGALSDRQAVLRHFPALHRLPRAELGVHVSPVERVALEQGGELWVKRDDLNAADFGGNKIRALQYLLAGVAAGDRVVTLGGAGSTHVLSTAVHAQRLGARTWAVRWPHEMNEVAREVSQRIEAVCERSPLAPAPLALLRLLAWRATARPPRVHFIPLGGSNALGVLGHVESALELAMQVETGLLPAPARVVVALGSGGTAAGLALGFALAGLDTEIIAARVGPRGGATRGRAMRLAAATRRFARERLGTALPPPAPIRVVHDVYGGAYGRVLPAGAEAAALLHRHIGVRCDPTYSAKAAAAALTLCSTATGPTLLWATFDGRFLEPGD